VDFKRLQSFPFPLLFCLLRGFYPFFSSLSFQSFPQFGGSPTPFEGGNFTSVLFHLWVPGFSSEGISPFDPFPGGEKPGWLKEVPLLLPLLFLRFRLFPFLKGSLFREFLLLFGGHSFPSRLSSLTASLGNTP